MCNSASDLTGVEYSGVQRSAAQRSGITKEGQTDRRKGVTTCEQEDTKERRIRVMRYNPECALVLIYVA